MEVFKTIVKVRDDVFHADTIRYKDAWWLVLTWLDSPDTGQEVPGRLLRLTGLQYQEIEGQEYRFVLTSEIPKDVFDGSKSDHYVVEDYLAEP